MNATLSLGEAVPEVGTRRQVLRLVTAQGPITAAELARRLGLTAAGIRRHLAELEDDGQVQVHEGAAPHGRGRPAKRYVATSQGQAALSQRYSELAEQALRFLADTLGDDALEGFAEQRARELEARLVVAVPIGDVSERAAAVAEQLSQDGYAATIRPVPGTGVVQLCQGHCPVQEVASEFPQLCEAETRVLSRVLGVHVQRLATLAGGGHVCTTSIPTSSLTSITRATSAEGTTA